MPEQSKRFAFRHRESGRPPLAHLGWIVAVCCLLSSTHAFAVSYRWSQGSYRIYVTGPGTVTLSDVKTGMPSAPLTQVAPGIWHLRANLVVENGGKLLLHGTKIGGDVNELRLQSNNTGESNAFVYLSADWGTLDIRSTSITSWDDDANGPDTESGALRRAFMRVRSSLDDDGITPHESRMDVIDSDVGYLGSHDAEAYGLVWKVIEPKHVNVGALTNLYNLVNVYGDITHSRLHHNYFGMYSYGAYGMRMTDNELDHNVGYGFDPHDDSDYLVIEGNNVHHNGWHGIIASQRCNNIIIRNNVAWANGKNGIMLHRYCDDSLIENNRCIGNGDSGVALFDNRRTTVRGNVCLRNFNAGIRLSVGAQDNVIENNEFGDGLNFGLYLYNGGDLPFPGDDGHPKRNRFVGNRIHHNMGAPIFLTVSDDNVFAGNIFDANGGPIRFFNGLRNRFESNSLPRDVTLSLQGLPDSPCTAIVRNQAALSMQVDLFSSVTFSDSSGRLFDPEETGLASTATAKETQLTLTSTQIEKTSYVQMRNLNVIPNAGNVKVTITTWNIPTLLPKRWLTQAGPGTTRITYKIGDLAPGTKYDVFKNGIATSYTADANGFITFQDAAITQAVAQFEVSL